MDTATPEQPTSPFENRPLICVTRPEDVDPDIPHCEGTVIVVLRIPASELPKMVTMTSMSPAERWRLKDSIDEQYERYSRIGL